MAREKTELRKLAEARLVEKGQVPDALSGQESRELIHELQTHQIELEIQNEELRRTERELTEARDRFSDLYDFAPIGYAGISENGLISEANLTLCNILGVERSKLLNQRFSIWVAEADQDLFYRHRKTILASRKSQTAELQMKKADESLFWAKIDGAPGNMDDEACQSLRIAISDISERKLADELILQLSQAVEQSGESIFITGPDGLISYTNPVFTRLTGYTAEEATGKTPGALLKSGRQNAALYQEMWETINRGKVWHGKLIDRRKDGSFFPVMLTISPIQSAVHSAVHSAIQSAIQSDTAQGSGITHFVGIQSDLTAIENLERQFHQAQKMEAIGTLVAGIAHDFNNSLAAITANTFLGRQRANDPSDVAKRFDTIERVSFHAAGTIKQLLTFARKDTPSMKQFPLAPFIKETIKLLRTSTPENIAIETDICSQPLSIHGDATQIHQALTNLVNNSRDALEAVHTPCIRIRLDAIEADDALRKKQPWIPSGTYAHLSVTDNGCGIAQSMIDHVYEPFFTTKDQGKGTGMGLAMAYGAVKSNHGFIAVDSIEGKGSTFHIYLPLLAEKETNISLAQHEDEPAMGHGETILIVDDDDRILDTTVDVLSSLGYAVLKARNGLQAIARFEEHADAIALCIFDIVMPDMQGDKAAEHIRAIRPDVKIIFYTGYDLNERTDMRSETVINKPFDIVKISHLIRQKLDS